MEAKGERGSSFRLMGFGICISISIVIVGTLYWIVSMFVKKG
jgi:hypothetical protein